MNDRYLKYRISITLFSLSIKVIYFVHRYLQYSINPEKIKLQDTPTVLVNVANFNPNGRQLTWQFLKLNWDFIMEKWVFEITL